MAFIALLTASAWALPAANQIWSEQPWISATPEHMENKATSLSDPVAFNLSGNEPKFISLGERQLNYTDYITSSSPLPSSEMWIRKDAVWSRYGQVTAGEAVELIVHTPLDGGGDIYLIPYANSTIKHWNIKFLSDYYYRLDLAAEESGRLFMLLAQAGEPGNALILDVLPRQSRQSVLPVDVNSILMGDASVTIKSQSIRGYDVYVDGVFYRNDMSDGTMDGVASLTIGGDKTHTITISQRDGQGGIINKNEHTKYFKRETAYTLLIE